ncbi:hypothetical protein FSARC_13773 [Fusarium sarcochroum]|uniref:Serine protease n=1 Tax=Fusarium sarcochroum TaxID=1208366 RepID=A0A8H4WS58_9HYPO|nr:hypothetical protein FSARC_13773 [Fusarium sarcochroum]
MHFSTIASLTIELLLFVDLSCASPRDVKSRTKRHLVARSSSEDNTGAATRGIFKQLIDHNNPDLGTFNQRFWWNADHYGGPGSPVIMEAPGEASVDEDDLDFSNDTLIGLFAQKTKGAVISLEHRYWGKSSPVGTNFTTETLQHLNLNQSIQDLVYFARNVHLKFDPHGKSKPHKAPWVLSGCSYPGALAAWTNALAPGTFWAYHCSSAVVEAVSTFWQYWSTIEEAIPRNCSADFKRIVKSVDRTLSHGSAHAKAQVKQFYGYDGETTDADFAGAISDTFAGFQDTDLTSVNVNTTLACDYIENQWPGSNAKMPGPEGVGLYRARRGLAKWMKKQQKESEYLTKREELDNKLWDWYLCNEAFEWWQVWGNESDSGLVPSALTRHSKYKECQREFPDVDGYSFGWKRGHDAQRVNEITGGWSVTNTERVMWVNGEYDPWIGATVSSKWRPGGPLKSTEEAPVWVIPKAAHCNDVWTTNRADPGTRKVIDAVVKQMEKWVSDYYKSH